MRCRYTRRTIPRSVTKWSVWLGEALKGLGNNSGFILLRIALLLFNMSEVVDVDTDVGLTSIAPYGSPRP